jgi:membrane-associated phospholipid phosphatase
MTVVSAAGRHAILWIVAGAGLALVGWISVRGLLDLLAALAFAWAASDLVLKPLFHRKRPFVRHPELRVIGRRPHDSSFPSAHAALAVAGAMMLSHLVPAGQALWWSVAIAIMYSRIYLGDHYPSDVAGGALVGLAAAALVYRASFFAGVAGVAALTASLR